MTRISIALILGLAACVVSVWIFTTWRSEPIVVTSPLLASLNTTTAPGERRDNLLPIFRQFFDDTQDLDSQRSILENFGFACRISAVGEPGNHLLTCQHRLPAYCEGYIYSAYQTLSGIEQQTATRYVVHAHELQNCPSPVPN